jgi:hypothetical protein
MPAPALAARMKQPIVGIKACCNDFNSEVAFREAIGVVEDRVHWMRSIAVPAFFVSIELPARTALSQ